MVDLTVEGQARPLPAGVEMSVYRIIQEALANVARHAPQSAARVILCYGPGQLRVEVVNAGPPDGHRAAAAPHGLPGGRGAARDAGAGGAVRRPARGRGPARRRVRGHRHHPLRQPGRPGTGMSRTGMTGTG